MHTDDLAKLTEAEKDVLRLLAQGHDTKSAATTLGISIHAINDRLREARRKLGVTSSREAARLLAGNSAQKIEGSFSGDDQPVRIDAGKGSRSVAVILIAGAVIMSLFFLAAMLWSSGAAEPSPPRVVAVSPAQGALIAPGPFTLTVTYDRPMRDKSWSFVKVSDDSYPDCPGRPVQSADGRSFSLDCNAVAGKRYHIWFNRGDYRNFRAPDGTSAVPFGLRFAVRR